MSATLRPPAEVYALLERMEKAGYFTPWGMVESISITSHNYLPMEGGLNGAFETLGAYHLLTKNRGITDVIYEASRRSPAMRQAVRLFYPASSQPPAPRADSQAVELKFAEKPSAPSP